MLAKTNAPVWAQTGWRENVSGRTTVVQYTVNGGHSTFNFQGPPDWQYTQYAVSHGSKFSFYKNGVLLHQGTGNFIPDKAHIFSEITNLNHQMPGDLGALSFMKFIDMEKRKAGSQVWSSFAPDSVYTTDNAKFYASNSRGGMNPLRELVTADRRGDCS